MDHRCACRSNTDSALDFLEACSSLPETQNMKNTLQNTTTMTLPELWGMVIQCAHASIVSCPSGMQKVSVCIQERLSWPPIKKDVSDYVAACLVCAQQKQPNASPAGLLHHFQSHTVPGQTSLWISLQTCLLWKVKQPY